MVREVTQPAAHPKTQRAETGDGRLRTILP